MNLNLNSSSLEESHPYLYLTLKTLLILNDLLSIELCVCELELVGDKLSKLSASICIKLLKVNNQYELF